MNIEDKALLILAAKADGRVLSEADIERGLWNPLENSLEAFNLLVHLKIKLIFIGDAILTGFCEEDENIPLGKDAYISARRAIVRCAAKRTI